MSAGGNSGTTNPFVRRNSVYSQNGMGGANPQFAQQQGLFNQGGFGSFAPQQQNPAYRSPFQGGMGYSMQRFGMPQGYGGKTMTSGVDPNFMGNQPPPPNNNPPPPGTQPPPPVTPEPTPAPYTPPQPTPTPTQTSPADPNGILGSNYHPQGGWGQSPGGLMSGQTAWAMGGPYGPKAPPPGNDFSGFGWNQATQAWEPMK